MIACNRQDALDAIQRIAQSSCCYAGEWPLNFCDCKYGGPQLREVKGALTGTTRWMTSEQTGCPELRTLYTLVATLTDDEWDDARKRAGMVTSAEIGDAIAEHFDGEADG